jgi:sigma-B regulation protein RsbU (phosphoserine phosphatase)
MFVTVLYGIMDCETGHFDYARAGHELPIILDQDNVEHVPPHGQGQPLALFEDPFFDTQGIQLGPGTTLLLYTDGATDSTGPDDSFFGLDRLKATMLADKRTSAQEVCDRLMDAIKDHQQDSTQYDDITLIAIHTHEM